MKSKKILSIILALVLIATLGLSACKKTDSNNAGNTTTTPAPSPPTNNQGGGSGAASPADIVKDALDYVAKVHSERNPGGTSTKDTLVFAAPVDPGKIMLDSLLDHSMYPFATMCVEHLVRFDYTKWEYTAPVCSSYDVDADYNGVTFHIKPGVMMNDGNTLSAQDIITSILAFRKHCGLAHHLAFIDLDNSKIVDELTLYLRFYKPTCTWDADITMLTLYSSKAYNALNGDESFFQNPVGPMAYYVHEWVPGDHITVVRNENYHLGTPPIKYVTMRIISDWTAAFMALQLGELDLLAALSAEQVRAVYASDKLRQVTLGENMVIYLGMNSGNKALSDFRVRQAIFMAVNRQDIIDGAFDGLAYPAHSILSREAIGYDTAWDTKSSFPPYDIARAKELMKEAGYGNGLTLRVLSEASPNFQLTVEQLAAQLSEIGITLQPELTDFGSVMAKITNPDVSGYDFYLHVAQVSDDGVATLDNPMLYGASHPELSADGSGVGMKELWNKVRSTPGVENRASVYREAHNYFFEKGLYWLPIAVNQSYTGLQPNLTGIRRNGFLLYYEGAYFK